MKIEQEREASTMTAPAVEFSTEKCSNLQKFVETGHIFETRNDEKRKVCHVDTVGCNMAGELGLTTTYPKIGSTSLSRLEANAVFFRSSMKGKFYVYLL